MWWCNSQAMGFWGWTAMAGFWVLLVLLVVWLVRLPGTARPPQDPGNALRILEDRLARGDIDSAEYKERRGTLEASR